MAGDANSKTAQGAWNSNPQVPGAGGVAPAEWGLIPDKTPGERLTTGEFLRYWFVLYNPLYFFSALCVFSGVYLVAGDVDNLRTFTIEQAHFGLFAIVQLYEFLLIAGAAFLVHRNIGGRVAAILALLELVFIYDCSFRLESIAHYATPGTAVSLAWVALTVVKVWALRAALALTVPIVAMFAIVAGAAGTAALVQLLSNQALDALITYQVAGWYGAGLALMIRTLRPRVKIPLAVLDADRIKATRALLAAPWVLGGFYFYHLWNHILWLGNGHPAAWLGQLSILLLWATLVVRQETHIWLSGIISIGLTASNPPVAFAGALLTAGAFAVRVHQGAPERLLISVVLLLYLAAAMFGWRSGQPFPGLPALYSLPSVLVVGGLLYLGWRKHQLLAWLILVVAGIYHLPDFSLPVLTWLPDSALTWGVLLLVAGFLALLCGLAVNWWLRGTALTVVAKPASEPERDTSPAPAPAAPGAELHETEPVMEHVATVKGIEAQAEEPGETSDNSAGNSNDREIVGGTVLSSQFETQVSWTDVGPEGQVGPAGLLRYIESARIAWLSAVGWIPDPLDYPLLCEVTEISARFERVVVWPDHLKIQTRVLNLSQDSIELEHTLTRAQTDEVVSIARSRLTALDADSKQRCPLPVWLHERIRLEPTPE